MIEVTNLTKNYGIKTAVDNVSFKVNSGEIVGFLGANGAGKSTTMNIITGFIAPTSGTAEICGIDISQDPISAKKKIGYLPEQPPLYLDMTVYEQLEFVCNAKSIIKNEVKKEIERVCDLVKITDVMNRVIKNLSKGYRQRVGLSQALIGSPEVLILDEPTVGLDPKQMIEIRNLIEKLGKNHTVFLSSHILGEVSAICNRVIVVDNGYIVADDSPANLSNKIQNSTRILIRVFGGRYSVEEAIKEINGIKNFEYQGTKEEGCVDFVIETASATDIRDELFNILSCYGYPIYLLQPEDMSLEDIFMKLTNKVYKEE